LRGLLIGTGGANRSASWYGLPAPALRWSTALDRLRSLDSAGSTSRDGTLAHGRVRPIPLRSGIAYVQPTYRWRPQSVPALNRIAVLVGDTARSLLPGNVPVSSEPAGSQPATATPASARALYNTMRDALRRGDWAAFGRAFDALGRALDEKKKP
jgi:uncharacterized membrane protein (UPF0182 family)